MPPGAAGTPPVKEHAVRLSPGRRAVLGGLGMTSMFGPNGQQVLVLIASIPGLSADQVDQVTSAWKQGSARDRARAWAQLNRAAAGDERYRILAAASLARREALGTARRMHRTDWAFWAAACDAGVAVAVGARIGRHYDTLVAPFAQVVPALARNPATAQGSAAASAADPQAAPGILAKSA
ncbi:MAG TPA: hypothetical protein VF060_05610 [Trebonia sp.]